MPNVRVNGRDVVASQLNDGLGRSNKQPANARAPPIKKVQTLIKHTPTKKHGLRRAALQLPAKTANPNGDMT